MLHIYYIPVSNVSSVISDQANIFNNFLRFIILGTFWSDIREDDNRSNHMLDYFMLGDTTNAALLNVILLLSTQKY